MTGGVQGALKRRQHHPGIQQVWQAMRIMRRFSLPELVTTTTPPVAYKTAAKYVARLRRCGYVRLTQPRHLGQPGSRDQLALVRDTGPAAPIPRHQAVAVYDPNTGRNWGDGGAALAETLPVPKARPMTPPSALQLRTLRGLAEGRTLQASVPHPENNGVVYAMRSSLRLRGLIDEQDALTEAGRSLAEWSAKA